MKILKQVGNYVGQLPRGAAARPREPSRAGRGPGLRRGGSEREYEIEFFAKEAPL